MSIEHPEMVKGLAKDGQKVIDELTPSSAHLLHMAVGIAGEAGELCEAIYFKHNFEEIDRENVIEELGDLEFYIEGLRQGLDLLREETLFGIEEKAMSMNEPLHVAKHNSIMLNIQCSILLDFIKKSAFYVKPVKLDCVVDALKNINERMYVLRECFGLTREETISHNIAKLGERYQGHNYSNEQAIDRADKDD